MPAESGLGGLKRQASMVWTSSGPSSSAGASTPDPVGPDEDRATSDGATTGAAWGSGGACNVHSVVWAGLRPSAAT